MNTQLQEHQKHPLILSDAAKVELIKQALPKLAKAVKKDKTIKLPEKMAGAPSLKGKVAAPVAMIGYGKTIATDYINALGKAESTWQDSIIHLLKTATDIQRNDAMEGAMEVAKACEDEVASQSLKKRISEARRVFKAATVKGHKKTLALFEGKGSWHQKVAKLPVTGKAGRHKSTPVTPVATVAEAMASVEKGGKPLVPLSHVDGVADGHTKVGVVKLGDVFGMIERLSFPDITKVVDLCAGRLMASKDIYEQSLGKYIVSFREKQERKAA